MQITKRHSGKIVELQIAGRVDVHWAEHLASAVNQEIRGGSHHIQLDLSQVPFISSAGIGVLVRFYRELASIQGSFSVTNCSAMVLKALAITNLEKLLVAKPPAHESTTETSAGRRDALPMRRMEYPEAIYEVYLLAPEAKLRYHRIGDASLLEHSGYGESDCRTVRFSDSTFAIGLGALGDDFADCRGRFGEFIATCGAAAYLPTDGTNAPDFLLAAGTTPPEMQVCYGLSCEGSFQSLVRFEALSSDAPVSLARIVEVCLDVAAAPEIGAVMIAESGGLVGAAMRKAPVSSISCASDSEGGIFSFPQIRDWLSFTAEPAYTRSVALLAGIAARKGGDELAPLLRPVTASSVSGPAVAGHFHAAAFSYRPVQKGRIDLKSSVHGLFECQSLEGVLHLLTDDRSSSGSRQSELIRGACWIAPIDCVTTQRAAE